MAGTETGGEPPTKKRKTKELPDELSRLTEDNFRKVMKFRLETDSHETGGEVKVAYEVSLGDTIVDLTKLTLDQLRQLCRNVGGVQYEQLHQIPVPESTLDTFQPPRTKGEGWNPGVDGSRKGKQQHRQTHQRYL
jgi:hypothetical protein